MMNLRIVIAPNLDECAGIQKSNGIKTHERHSLEIQRDRRLLTIDLTLQFIEMLGFQPTY
jgi:hypothetical protein